MRLSTALTQRIVACAEDLPEHIGLPRGSFDDLRDLLDGLGVQLVLEDRRLDGEPLDVPFRGRLTKLQERAAEELAAHDMGHGCGGAVASPPSLVPHLVPLYGALEGTTLGGPLEWEDR